jgi:SP family general alpha glucoside:H+ symporter-like MFS transporter
MSEKHSKDERHIETAIDLDEKAEIAHFEGGKDQHGQHTTLIEEALAQREEESKMSLWKIFQLYYPGATYGLLLSVALVMEGYDTGLVSVDLFFPAIFAARPIQNL